jgi:small-conductance mechanosensitive channel
MTTDTTAAAAGLSWHSLWRGEFNRWLLTSGLHIVLLLIGAVLAARFVNWAANKVTQRLDAGFAEGDALVRSEATKHRQAVAAVISWMSTVLIAIAVAVEIADILRFSIRGLVAPATVMGAALGFGAQRLVQDLLAGFFVIAEKQYGFGDLVELTTTSGPVASGTVENVTLRVTKLRSADGEVFTVPNGQIVKTANLSKDWARAVIDIPVSNYADLNLVNEVLHQECEHAREDAVLGELLLDAPTVMGVESIDVDTVTLRLVARTLPGRQFEVGRQLRRLVVEALARAGIGAAGEVSPVVGAIVSNARQDAQDEAR